MARRVGGARRLKVRGVWPAGGRRSGAGSPAVRSLREGEMFLIYARRGPPVTRLRQRYTFLTLRAPLLPPVERHTCHALSVIYRAGQVPSVSQSLTAPRMLLALAAGVTLLLIGSAQALGQPALSTPATPDVVETSSIQISG